MNINSDKELTNYLEEIKKYIDKNMRNNSLQAITELRSVKDFLESLTNSNDDNVKDIIKILDSVIDKCNNAYTESNNMYYDTYFALFFIKSKDCNQKEQDVIYRNGRVVLCEKDLSNKDTFLLDDYDRKD